MLTKDNVTIGIEWRLGPDWPGQRCGAKTRRGTSCQRPANKKNGRCRLHGEASTGAKTEEGLARISAANLRHGKFTKDKLDKRRANAAKGREIRKELRQLERELIAGDHLVSPSRDSGRQNQPRSGARNLVLVMPNGSCMRCGSARIRFSRRRQSRVSKQTGIRHLHGHFPVPMAKTSPRQLSSKHIVVHGRDLCANLLGSAPTT